MSAGYSGTPLARKLGIREDHRVAVLNAPPGFRETLGALPDGTTVQEEPDRPGDFDHPEARSTDVVILFCRDSSALAADLAPARRLLAWDGGLWISWPKGSSDLATDLGKFDVRDAGLEAGLVDNKVCAVDDDWSGLRFVYRTEDRP